MGIKVLIGCEYSGVVRDAFIKRGHSAVSCDLLPSKRDGPHLQCPVEDILDQGWDMMLLDADIPKIALENPISVISSHIRKPDQIIQPWQFGHGETKAICLWLKNLPLLQPTNIVEGREARVHKMPPGPDRWKERSRTYQGIADAMAVQWG